MRLAIIGGGGFRVPLVYRALLRHTLVDDVVLFDIDTRRLQVILAVLAGDSARPGAPALRAAASLEDALLGADFVFSAVRVGGANGRIRDEQRALRRGVLGQETVGAGGIAYGLRTLPVALQIARAVAAVAPSAWVVNFTNPAGLITEASRSILGERVIGICDSPVGLVRRARVAAGSAAALADYAGINHLGWLRSLRVDGDDLLPSLLASDDALETFEEGRLFGGPLLRALGAIPNEYLTYYYDTASIVAALGSRSQTRGGEIALAQAEFYASTDEAPARWEDTRQRREQTYLAEARPAADERDATDLTGGGYETVAVELMSALAGAGDAEIIVNVANGSTLPQLPADLVIETTCTVSPAGARPLPVAPLTLHQLGLVAAVRAAERAAISAVADRSRDAALAAFALHPLVGSTSIAEAILLDLLADEPDLATLLRW